MMSLWEAILKHPLEQGRLTPGPDLCGVHPTPRCGTERTCTEREQVWAPLHRIAPELPEALPQSWHCPLWIAAQIHQALQTQATQPLKTSVPGTAGWMGLPSATERLLHPRVKPLPRSLWRQRPWPELWTAWEARERVWWEWVGVDTTGTMAWLVGMRDNGHWVAVEGLATARGWTTSQVIFLPTARLIYRTVPEEPWGWSSRTAGGDTV